MAEANPHADSKPSSAAGLTHEREHESLARGRAPKAYNLRDKSFEVVRMLRALAEDDASADKHESEFTLEFEQPALLTLGVCYEHNGRFSGGAYLPVVSRCEEFRDSFKLELGPDHYVLYNAPRPRRAGARRARKGQFRG